MPEPEEVAKKVLYAPRTLTFPTKADYPVRFLENSVYFDIHSDPIQIKDLGVIPFVTRNRDFVISLYQHFRDIEQSFNVNGRLRDGLRNVVENNKWLYKDENNDEIIVFKDWTEGMQERYEFKMPVPHGHYVLIDEKYLDEKLRKNGLRLGYVLKTTFRGRKYNIDEVQEIKDFKLINVSRIIIN